MMSPANCNARPTIRIVALYDARMRTLRLALLLVLVLAPGWSRPPAEAREATPPAAQRAWLVLAEPGAWRLTKEALAAAGLPTAERLTFRRGGREAPTYVENGNLVLLAERPANDHSRAGVWELGARTGPALTPRPASASSAGTPSKQTAIVRLDADRYHGDIGAGQQAIYDRPNVPTWFLSPLDPQGDTTIEDLGRLRLAFAGPTTLRVRVFATRPGEVQLRPRVDDFGLGASSVPDAVGGATLSFEVPGERLADAKQIAIVDESPPGAPPSRDDVTPAFARMWIDSIEAEGTLAGIPAADRLPLSLDVARGAAISLPTPPEGATGTAFVLAKDGALRAAFTWSAETALPPFDEDGLRIVLAGPAQDAPPLRRAETFADPVAAAKGAEHVIVATLPLAAASERLAAHRRAEGLESVVVPAPAIWWAFGHGEATPEALRSYVEALLALPGSRVRHLLLVGDATYDRSDLTDVPTIPVPMARTKYNGATAADRLYGLPLGGAPVGGVSVGRLPFRDPQVLQAYIERLAAYENDIQADLARRRLAFVTSEGRFGPMVDGLLEHAFRQVVTQHIPPVYDIEITFANPRSPYLWPPAEFAAKVVSTMNEGALFFTYVGHGYEKGFDTMRVGKQRFPILDLEAAKAIDVTGTPPVVMVLACTTAMVDGLAGPGIGEALISRPRGPIAYWGATRICHPAANTLLGLQLAEAFGSAEPGTRLGPMLDTARDAALGGAGGIWRAAAIGAFGVMRAQGYDIDADRLLLESSWMYGLLGDPATRLPVPERGLELDVKPTPDGGIEVVVRDLAANGAATKGAQGEVRLARNRSAPLPTLEPIANAADPTLAEAIRRNHARANELVEHTAPLVWTDGVAKARLAGPFVIGQTIQAIVTVGSTLRHGALVLEERHLVPAGTSAPGPSSR